MSGGIRYRLSPKELEFFGQYLSSEAQNPNGLYGPLRQQLLGAGVDFQLTDQQCDVEVEETKDQVRFTILYPIDQDLNPNNGRIYLEDEFILSKENLPHIKLERSLKPSPKKAWVDPPPGKFERELWNLVNSPTSKNALQTFNEKVLQHLHRPIPELNEEARQLIRDVYQEPLKVMKENPLKAKMQFPDPQSGLTLQKKNGKLLMDLTIVLDNSLGSQFMEEKNGRIYLTDHYEIDPSTHRVIHHDWEYQLENEKNEKYKPLHVALQENAPATAAPSPLLDSWAAFLLKEMGIPKSTEETLPPSPLEVFSLDPSPQNKQSEEGFHLLLLLTLEKSRRKSDGDRAWFKAAWNWLSGGNSNDWNNIEINIHSLFRKLEKVVREKDIPLRKALTELSGLSLEELALRERMLGDPAIRELLSIYNNKDDPSRHEALIHFARSRLLVKSNLPQTAYAILQVTGPLEEEGKELEAWLTGKAGFGQKLEMVGRHVPQEVLAPTVLTSMILSGGAGGLGKLAFLSRWGNHSRTLRMLGEGAAVLAEAPVFTLSDKLLKSAFLTPVEQWDRPASDLFGNLFAFGGLRYTGLGVRALNRYLAEMPALQNFARRSTSLERFKDLVPYLEPKLEKLGRAAPAGRWVLGIAKPPLDFLSKKSISHHWALPVFQFASTHSLTLGGLVLANSFSRWVTLRKDSPQGGTADVVDDALMYGHFLMAGNLAHRMRLRTFEPYLEALERPLEAETKVMMPLEAESPVEPTIPSGLDSSVVSAVLSRPLGPRRAVAFLKPPNFLLSSSREGASEWILGRETPESMREGSKLDLPFSSQFPMVVPRHAKIQTLPVEREGQISWEYALTPLEGKTYLGEKLITQIEPLTPGSVIRLGEEGPLLKFEAHPKSYPRDAFLEREPLPLWEGQQEWSLGRESPKQKEPVDILLPPSELDISRRHLTLWRNGEGSFSLRDESSEGTRVNGVRLLFNSFYPLPDGDLITLGRSGTMFRFIINPSTPLTTSPEASKPMEDALVGTRGISPFPAPYQARPEQAPVHPSFAKMTQAEVDQYILRLSSDPRSTLASAIAAILKPKKGDFFRLMANKTGWILGKNPSGNPQRTVVALGGRAPEVDPNHGAIYLDTRGRYILEDLSSKLGLYVQWRKPGKEKEFEPGPRQRVVGWTILSGGERIHFGPKDGDFYLDFWPREVPPPPQ